MNEKLETGRALRDEIVREQVRLALRHLPTMQIASFLVALVLCSVVRDDVPHVNILVWLLMMLSIVVARITLYHRFRRVSEGPFVGDYWKAAYLILALVSGIFWGLSAFIIFPAGNPELISLFVLVIASLSAATTVSHSSIKMAPASWAVPAMLLYAIRCFMGMGQFGYTVGSLIILYLCTILRYSFIHNNSITSAIALKFENLELLQEVHKVNDALRQDTLERKQAEEEHIRLSQAIEQIAEGIIVSDMQGIVQYINPAFEQMSGFNQDEIIGHHLVSINGGKQDRPDYGTMWVGTSMNYPRSGCFTNKRKDGSLYQVEATVAPVRDTSGNVTNYISIQRDVTREMVLEDQLRQAQKMEAIGTLAGGIANDFNNILGIIMGYMDLAKRESPENEKTGQHIKDALNACRRAKDLIRQILSFSRTNDRTERLLLDIRPTIKEVTRFFKASLPSTIEVRDCIPSRACSVLAHPTQIHQVLTNLCANAAQAMGETGGILEVSLVNVDFDPLTVPPHPGIRPGPYARLSVADMGEGMDSATLDRIFDPYFTTKGAGKGIGLGLAVVHGIVKSHDGVITVSSEVGKGTIFHVYLPRIDRESGTLEESGSQICMGNERILFVDDEEQLANIWQKALERLGYRVTTRTSCLEALELFRVHPNYFDLVITDYTMPHMNGIDLARQMMRIQPDIPVILCTGFKEGTLVDRTSGAGLRALLMKPLELSETAEIIREVLDKKR
jgi:PAS domain S-box-containing protein